MAEDYIGTGIAWGVVFGLSVNLLEEMNKDLVEPGVQILLDGPQRQNGIEKGHIHENDLELWKRSRQIHLELARRYGWIVVDASGTVENVASRVWDGVKLAGGQDF